MTNTFQDIKAWQYAHKFVLSVYSATRNFPEYERFGLFSQFTRAAVSIPANIAEGYKRVSKSDKLHFLNYSQASLEECRYYIILSRDLKYITEDNYNQLIDQLEKTSWYINSYCKGIINNKGIKE